MTDGASAACAFSQCVNICMYSSLLILSVYLYCLTHMGVLCLPKKLKYIFHFLMVDLCIITVFVSSSACLIVNSIIPFFPLFACLFICHPSGLPYIINTLTHYLWIYSIHFFDLLNIILYFFVI